MNRLIAIALASTTLATTSLTGAAYAQDAITEFRIGIWAAKTRRIA